MRHEESERDRIIWQTSLILVAISCWLPRVAFMPQATDGPELVAAGITGALAHPPGYPFLSYLFGAASALSPGCAYYTCSILSWGFQTVAALLFFDSLFVLSKSKWISFLAVLGWMLYLPTLLTATDAEVFALHHLFVAIFLRLTLQDRAFALTAFVFGLGLSHHHLMILWFPLFLIVLIRSPARAVVGMLLGLSGYLLLFVRFAAAPELSFAPVRNLGEFLIYVLRLGYGSFSLALPGDAPVVSQFGAFVEQLLSRNPIVVVVSAIALGSAAVHRSSISFAFEGVILLHLIFTYLLQIPEGAASDEWMMRFFSTAALPLFVLAPALLTSRRLQEFLPFALAFSLIPQFVRLEHDLLRGDRTTKWEVASSTLLLLSTVPRGGVLITTSDEMSFGVAYARQVYGVRPDVRQVIEGKLGSRWYRDSLAIRLGLDTVKTDVQDLAIQLETRENSVVREQ